ncbi:MAG: L-threonylcarbamoyladenylate synthase [Phycisphaerales bacterium]|nr:L-threonylcarbamoyladenylate synthase [Phycisphaerales bacterium]
MKTQVIKWQPPAPPGGSPVEQAIAVLRGGGVIGFPTETVYGLGGDARREDAVKAIYKVKGRPAGNPVIVHVAGLEAAQACAAQWPHVAETLAKHFWPGPLTLVLKRAAGICPLVSAGLNTVALRWPCHPVAEAILRGFSGPVAAPSANRSGFTSPTTAGHVLAELAGRVPLIVDGGPCEIGVESTVVDASSPVPTVLRPGGVTLEQLQQVIGEVKTLKKNVAEGDIAQSPGMHSRHYAPRHAAFRFTNNQWPGGGGVRKWAEANCPVALLTFQNDVILETPHETTRMPEDAQEYARLMFAAMREADAKNVKAILVLEPQSEAGMWAAVRDRLNRATLPWTEVVGWGGAPHGHAGL